uniref:SFRICE_020742 n=1 Tax=Spodoptera frugiperda TaxID=7108 RepID=A0A2H1W338_SPOFR
MRADDVIRNVYDAYDTGLSQRLAAVAAVSHARHYYNHTQPDVLQTETSSYNINIFFVSVTLCGVLVAVCAACWRRSPASDKPEDNTDCHGVYTVSGDTRLTQVSLRCRIIALQT